MMYQTLKHFFIRIGLSFFLLVTFGFFTLYFLHEVALPNTVFDDSLIQWSLFLICIFIGFFAYGLIGEQRFHNAMHNFKDISSAEDPEEVIDGFQAVLDFTYSAYFLPGQGKRLRNNVILQFADYLLFAGREDSRAQKIYLKAFFLRPNDFAYRAPLLSIFRKGDDLTSEEIDLLLVILKAGKYRDDVIVSNLSSLFLSKHLFTKKTEPVFLAALKNENENSEEIVNLVLPQLLEAKRSDSFALHFYLRALSWESPSTSQAREIVSRSYCEGVWKGADPSLHQKCGEVFQELNYKCRSDMMREVAESRLPSKVKKLKLLNEDDLLELKKLKAQMGFSKSFLEYFRDLFWSRVKVFLNLIRTLISNFLKIKAWVFIIVIILTAGLGYRGWQVQQKKAVQMESEVIGTQEKILDNRGKSEIHTFQVAAFTSFKQARSLIDLLKKKGVRNVYQVKTKRKSGETWYKIRVGRFDSKENARRFADQLIDQKTIKNYFIISLPTS